MTDNKVGYKGSLNTNSLNLIIFNRSSQRKRDRSNNSYGDRAKHFRVIV